VSENDQAGSVGRIRSAAPGSSGLTWLAAAAIVTSALIMVVVSAAGPSVSVPRLPATGGPPWWHHSLHLTATFVTVSLWVAMALGCAGVIAGLVAVDRGARLPVRAVVAFAVLATAAFTLLPSAGSTDSISYAVNGRTAVIGHSPYVMTPLQLERSGDPVGRQIPFAEIPPTWTTTVSVYGPVATGAEWAAAELGGTSLARITFWLKLEEALAFGAVIVALDRMLRADPARRLRAHLLWSVNPLLLWEIVASGHIDGLAALFGLLGVAALRRRRTQTSPSQTSATQTSASQTSLSQTSSTPNGAHGQIGLRDAALAGLAIGVATGIKAEYALFGLAVAWACRRSVKPLAAAAAGFVLAVVPAYLAAGTPAIKVLITRSPGITWDTMYQLFWRPVLGYTQFGVTSVPPHLELVAYLLFAAVAVLAVLRLPDPLPDLPAVTPALALSLAWLFVTAFQRPWYDVMALSLLALYSASRLDWVVLIRLLAGATVYVQAVQSPAQPHWLANLGQFDGAWLTPGVRLLATVALVWLCLSGRWGWRSASAVSAGRLPELLPAT
jgi:alpha-1,6-mannosyltransferase